MSQLFVDSFLLKTFKFSPLRNDFCIFKTKTHCLLNEKNHALILTFF